MATKLGTKGTVKKTFGEKEVLKEVLNGITVYEKPETNVPYITISSPNSFSFKTTNGSKNWNGTLELSQDGTNWSTWNGAQINVLGISESRIYIRGTSNTYICGALSGKGWQITSGSNIKVKGNVENLLDYATVMNGQHPTVGERAFTNLFSGFGSALTDVSELIIGCETLSKQACTYMFQETAITLPPICKAKYLAGTGAFSNMFYECRSLTKVMDLNSIETINGQSFMSMYRNCSALTQINNLKWNPGSYNTVYQLMYEYCPLIKISETQTGEYVNEFRIPSVGTGTATGTNVFQGMFSNTGGTYTSDPVINTTYYTSNQIV